MHIKTNGTIELLIPNPCQFLPGTINHKVVPVSDLLDPSHCSQSAEWSLGFPGAICDHTMDFHRLSFNNPTPSSLKAKDVILTNSYGIKIHTLANWFLPRK